MITVDIPGFKTVVLKYLVLDYNGTIAVDGVLVDGVKEASTSLSKDLDIHVVTADTFGMAAAGLEGIPLKLSVLDEEHQDISKLEYIKRLGSSETVSIGNGRNDKRMLKASVLGIAVVLEEGASGEALMAADVVTKSILSALELLTNPLRLKATLRS